MKIRVEYHAAGTDIHVFSNRDFLRTIDACVGHSAVLAYCESSSFLYGNFAKTTIVDASAVPSASAGESWLYCDVCPLGYFQHGHTNEFRVFVIQLHSVAQTVADGHSLGMKQGKFEEILCQSSVKAISESIDMGDNHIDFFRVWCKEFYSIMQENLEWGVIVETI